MCTKFSMLIPEPMTVSIKFFRNEILSKMNVFENAVYEYHFSVILFTSKSLEVMQIPVHQYKNTLIIEVTLEVHTRSRWSMMDSYLTMASRRLRWERMSCSAALPGTREETEERLTMSPAASESLASRTLSWNRQHGSGEKLMQNQLNPCFAASPLNGKTG